MLGQANTVSLWREHTVVVMSGKSMSFKKAKPVADLSTKEGRRQARRELIWEDHGFLRMRFSNLHQISDEMWRSNQPSPRQIGEHAKIRGIRSIINLRGTSPKGYYLLEKQACDHYGINLIDFQLFSRELPPKQKIHEARSLFQSITYPALMHCKSGSDRAGMMSLLYKLLREEVDFEEASQQLSFKYLHIRLGKTGVLDAFVEAYQRDSAKTSISFLDWIDNVYDPIEIKKNFLKAFHSRFNLSEILARE